VNGWLAYRVGAGTVASLSGLRTMSIATIRFGIDGQRDYAQEAKRVPQHQAGRDGPLLVGGPQRRRRPDRCADAGKAAADDHDSLGFHRIPAACRSSGSYPS
jgi:hypothetical protein